MNISALATDTFIKLITLDSSMKRLSIESLTLQIGRAELPLAPFLLKFGWERLRNVLPTIALQVPLDRAHGELPSDARTLISHWEKFRRKTGEIWRSVIATSIR